MLLVGRSGMDGGFVCIEQRWYGDLRYVAGWIALGVALTLKLCLGSNHQNLPTKTTTVWGIPYVVLTRHLAVVIGWGLGLCKSIVLGAVAWCRVA